MSYGRQSKSGTKPRHNMPWRVHGAHIIPDGDLREHSINECWCFPTEDEGLLIHHSLDRREDYENGQRKPA
jgi:hypothetical protein